MYKVSINSVSVKDGNAFRPVLNNFSFTLAPNNIYTIVGKNGQGKSTLIRLFANLLDTKEWKVDACIENNGVNILSLPYSKLTELRQKEIHYVFQDPINSFDPLKKIGYYFTPYNNNLFSVEELFLFFKLPSAKEIFKLHSYELSGGMAQRISIALALLKDPALLILDEPTSGIDAETVDLLEQALVEFIKKPDKIILLITQELSFAKAVTNKIAMLINGMLTDFMPYDDFIQNNTDEIQSFIKAYNIIQNG